MIFAFVYVLFRAKLFMQSVFLQSWPSRILQSFPCINVQGMQVLSNVQGMQVLSFTAKILVIYATRRMNNLTLRVLRSCKGGIKRLVEIRYART